ncbi:MAG: restriction endonuclease subunit S, partial [Patescibacteria group bacterium]
LDLKIVLPPQALIVEYEKVAGSLISLSISLNKQNQNLRQTRDLLLPKLVTGEIEVRGSV